MTPFEAATVLPLTESRMHAMSVATGVPVEEIRRHNEDDLASAEVWLNDVYRVRVDRRGLDGPGWPLIHLSIKRVDREPIHDWRDLQRIKNELVGPEHEAVELYPAESRLVDSANQYHLWVMADNVARWPFGFNERFVQDNTAEGTGAKQRPRE
jgi:hypothetical protein